MAGLYIHIPFCHAKCAYCDFYSTPLTVDIDAYIDSVSAELRMRIDEVNEPFTTIYIGGGTPSLLPATSLKRLVCDGIYPLIDRQAVMEFTIEANPEDVTSEFVDTIQSVGINRVSMGIQSFNNAELAAIGRRHDSATALKAIGTLREGGVANISCDLIYGLPSQDLGSWEQSLQTLLSDDIPHFSAYLLSYEQGTRLYARLMSGKVEEAPEELVVAMYNHLIAQAHAYGYSHYEISNFAKPGAAAIHNSNYWENMPYLGIGVSAHSFDGKLRRYNPPNIRQYIIAMRQAVPFCVEEPETDEERYNTFLITRLRTSTGIDLPMMEKLWGEDAVASFLRQTRKFLESGKMQSAHGHVFIAEPHLLISDSILRDLILVPD